MVKIDRSFIQNVHEDTKNIAIIKTIVDLATNLQMATVGEGIEHAADAELLDNLNCKFGQGYHFAKPMQLDDLTEFIKQTVIKTILSKETIKSQHEFGWLCRFSINLHLIPLSSARHYLRRLWYQ